ncbi:MAG: methyltransferase domain-containing protein [Candidatus Parabeggiatoa sp.]|nr:methyltransferase domain-containing protein [Candidatus Parabeggiatoa sp.]
MKDYYSLNRLSPLVNIRSHFVIKARQKMFDLFNQVIKPTATCRILDLGVTPDRSLPESNLFECLYPHKQNITAASIEEAYFLEEIYPGMRFVKITDNHLSFDDDEFDVVFCSAVLEHVGDQNAQQAFVQEALRVSKKFFFTTPNRQFPIDFHTMIPMIHWLPQSKHQWILSKLGYDFWAKTENLNLLTPKAVLNLFPSPTTTLYKYRLFGLPSNLILHGTK